MSRPDTVPLDAEDKAHFDRLFRQAALDLQGAHADEDALMAAVVSKIVADIDRLQEAGDVWAVRWSERVADLALVRLAERQLSNCRPRVH